MLNAVIFDFDGVIVDSEPLHYQALQAVLNPLGKGFSWEEYCRTCIGFNDRDIFKNTFESEKGFASPGLLQQLISEKTRTFQRYVNEREIKALPGAIELINSFPGSFPIALCSGGIKRDILPLIAMLGIQSTFHTIVTAEDTVKSKPDPAPYLLAARNLGLMDPSTAVAVEDTLAGITSAKGAGLRVLAVTNSFDRKHLLEADAVTDSLERISRNSLEAIIFSNSRLT
jgi:HAD superfamily hydrolase (TIGR01509 family)